MALRECFECKGAVSTEASACPHCGAPSRRTPVGMIDSALVSKLINVFLVVGWPLFVIAFLIQMSHSPNGFWH